MLSEPRFVVPAQRTSGFCPAWSPTEQVPSAGVSQGTLCTCPLDYRALDSPVMTDNEPAQPANKLAEQATAKAELSYSYWAGQRPANSDSAPKKLTPEEAAALEQQKAGEQGVSAWNSAGTFEERTVTEWAKPRLSACLVGLQQGAVRVSAVTNVTGDAHIWFIRGKKRHGFEFNITMAWQSTAAADSTSGSSSSEALEGTLRLPTASPDDLDDLHMEVEITSKAGADEAQQQAALKEARQLKDKLAAALERFYAELKKQ